MNIIKKLLFRTGIQPHQLRGGALKGLKFNLDLQKDTQVWRGIYERPLQDWLGRLVPSGACCLDVGAADGYFTLLMALKAGPTGRVEAFEPSASAGMISANIALNSDRLLASCKIHKSFVVGPKLAVDGSRTPIAESEIVIDDFVDHMGFQRVDIIKIDIEGYEAQALEGATRTIKRFRPHLFIEVHSKELLSDIKNLLLPFDYTMKLEMPASYEHRPIAFNAFYYST